MNPKNLPSNPQTGGNAQGESNQIYHPGPPFNPEKDGTPKINAQFWFDLSEGLVKGAIERLDTAIESFNKLIIAVYGLYTGANLIALNFGNATIYELVILALPYTLLLITQWKTVAFSGPISAQISPNSFSKIQKAYEEAYIKKEQQLTTLKRLSFWAIASTGVALTSAFVLSKLPLKETYVEIQQIMLSPDQRKVQVAGYVTANDSNYYHLTIFQHKILSNNQDSTVCLLDEYQLRTQSGEFQQTISVSTSAQYYTATLEYFEKGKRSIQQSTVKPITIPVSTTTGTQTNTQASIQSLGKNPSPINTNLSTQTNTSVPTKRTKPTVFK